MSRKLIYLLTIFVIAAVFHQNNIGQKKSTRTDRRKVQVAAAPIDENVALIEGKVVFVYDGDTVSIETKDRRIYALRLQGIDAPEDKQEYSKKSQKALAKLVQGKVVRAIIHKKDLYDRYIGGVYLNGEDVALKQIAAGMAWHFKRFGSEQTPEERRKYAQAELTARAAKIGLWKDDEPTPPWDYREGERAVKDDRNETDSQRKNTTVPSPEGKRTEREYIRGPLGGCYYVSASGRKVYVKDKSLCGVP